MSSKRSATESFGRRTWDEKEYEERARQRYEERKLKDAASDKGKTSVHAFFKSRQEQLDKIDSLNRVSFVGSLNAKEAGFYCDICNRKFKDDLKFIDHLNSREHLVNSGFEDDSELHKEVTLDQVKERLRMLKEAKITKQAQGEGGELDFRQQVELLRQLREKEKEKRRLKKQRKKLKTSTDEPASDEIAAVMGFGSFQKGK